MVDCKQVLFNLAGSLQYICAVRAPGGPPVSLAPLAGAPAPAGGGGPCSEGSGSMHKAWPHDTYLAARLGRQGKKPASKFPGRPCTSSPPVAAV